MAFRYFPYLLLSNLFTVNGFSPSKQAAEPKTFCLNHLALLEANFDHFWNVPTPPVWPRPLASHLCCSFSEISFVLNISSMRCTANSLPNWWRLDRFRDGTSPLFYNVNRKTWVKCSQRMLKFVAWTFVKHKANMDVSWKDALICSLFVHRSIFVLLNRFQCQTERKELSP